MRKILIIIVCLFVLAINVVSVSAIKKEIEKTPRSPSPVCEIIVKNIKWSVVDNSMVGNLTLKNVTNKNLRGSIIYFHWTDEKRNILTYSAHEITQDFPPDKIIKMTIIGDINPEASKILLMFTDSEALYIYKVCKDSNKIMGI